MDSTYNSTSQIGVKYMNSTQFSSQTTSKSTCKLILPNEWKIFGNFWNRIYVGELDREGEYSKFWPIEEELNRGGLNGDGG